MPDILKRLSLVLIALALAAVVPPAAAQTYPDRPVKLIVPFPPGGATDTLGRILGKKMAEILGQPVVVENHGGAGGTIGTDFTSRQPADGYTVMLVSALAHTASKNLYANLKYDPVKSFTPIGSIGVLTYVLVVNPGMPAQDLPSLVKLLKSAPDKYTFASPGVGTAPHLAAELFLRAADVKLLHVPYQGSGPAVTGMLSGDVNLMVDNVAAIPLIKSGKLRAIAQTGARRSAALPDVPTFAEAGMPQFDVTAVWGLIAPGGTPERAVAVLSDAMKRAVEDQTVRETLLAQIITPAYGTSQSFGQVLAAESERWSKLIESANIKPQ